jgi:aryl-alcohol dehydrogenase-like predicted oxidoreductase
MSLAYLIALGPNVWPVIGPRNASQLRDSYGAGTIRLAPEIVREIAAATGQAGFFD